MARCSWCEAKKCLVLRYKSVLQEEAVNARIKAGSNNEAVGCNSH